MKHAIYSSWLVLALAASAAAQTPAIIDVRVTGAHTLSAADTEDTAKALAVADAERKALAAVTIRLEERAEVKALPLKPNQLAAYVPALVELPEPATRNAPGARPAASEVELVLRVDAAEMIRRIALVRRDQDAGIALLELWTGTEALYRQLAAETAAEDRQRTLTALRVKRLVARLTAAIAKTEERPVGGRAPSADGSERAKKLADAALAASPASGDAHAGKALVLMAERQTDAAEAEYRQALRENAGVSSGHIRLANALIAGQKAAEAAAELREALRLDPASVQAHTDLGWVLRSQGNIPESIAEYEQALRLDPDFIDAHNGLAVTLASQGRLPEAVVHFREIVRIDPDSAVGYYNLSYALADMDQDAESAAALREVVRINPNHYNARYNLGELFRLEGKFDESARQFREYLRLAPAEPQNRRNIDRAKDFIAKFENP